ncbi:MAG: hypothetical protein BJ554DRAFT_610 [Olpidium bornovanus]|uniref:Gamma-soluble NSF attachment protein n=1 Tax=Olpidium bornovanus TaxID=278681 RepID=A0A8H8DI03_9FUNG|nr:MAG: hypothetical protein BJ554DRAFT_610 [Olpidium bornovanus]
MESAALVVHQQSNQPVKAGELYNRASDLYHAHGASDKAAEMLEKAGKANEAVDVDRAIEYYIMACTMYEQEDRARFALETFKRTLAVLLKHKSARISDSNGRGHGADGEQVGAVQNVPFDGDSGA